MSTMAGEQLRERIKEPASKISPPMNGTIPEQKAKPHPAGNIQHGPLVEALRLLAFVAFFLCCALSITLTQLVGLPLYYWNQDYYYAWMAMSKQSFGVFVTTLTQVFAPTVVRVTWDSSVRGQFKKTQRGKLQLQFPERMILLSNHQIYTDWLYLWWSAYANKMHGHLFIILKESLKYMPIISPGILFYGFIFMSRKWSDDKLRIKYRLQKLKSKHSGPLSGSAGLDPMWLLIYPEGTNLSANTRKQSAKWAEKQNMPDLKHQLLPRSTGLQFCLQELEGSVDWIYDCTIAYEGVPKGGYAPEYFTLRSVYLQGRPPKSTSLHWRRFAVSEIPVSDPEAFSKWVLDRWKEKDQLLETFYDTGRFSADDGSNHGPGGGYIETEVKLEHWYEVAQIFIVLAALAMVVNVFTKLYTMMFR